MPEAGDQLENAFAAERGAYLLHCSDGAYDGCVHCIVIVCTGLRPCDLDDEQERRSASKAVADRNVGVAAAALRTSIQWPLEAHALLSPIMLQRFAFCQSSHSDTDFANQGRQNLTLCMSMVSGRNLHATH